MNLKEEWVNIKGTKGNYQISSLSGECRAKGANN